MRRAAVALHGGRPLPPAAAAAAAAAADRSGQRGQRQPPAASISMRAARLWRRRLHAACSRGGGPATAVSPERRPGVAGRTVRVARRRLSGRRRSTIYRRIESSRRAAAPRRPIAVHVQTSVGAWRRRRRRAPLLRWRSAGTSGCQACPAAPWETTDLIRPRTGRLRPGLGHRGGKMSPRGGGGRRSHCLRGAPAMSGYTPVNRSCSRVSAAPGRVQLSPAEPLLSLTASAERRPFIADRPAVKTARFGPLGWGAAACRRRS